MLPHLNLKVDRFTITDPFLQELLAWMFKVKFETMYHPTGKLLGHDIHWTIIKQPDPRCKDGHLTFEFNSEADKIQFILKTL